MIHYILQVIAFQLVFLLIYDAFLKRETFFNCNRFYLLVTALLAFVLPFIELDAARQVVSQDFAIRLPEVIIGELSINESELANVENTTTASQTSKVAILPMLFWVGLLIAALFFVIKTIKLLVLKERNTTRWYGDVLIVKLLKSTAAFSFFNMVFLGDNINQKQKPIILAHELVHVKHKHSIDLLVFEILRIIMWFNPLIYMYHTRIRALHEYIADAISVQQSGKSDYYQSLLHQVFDTHEVSFTNTFYKKSLIKKRIKMLQKSKSKQVKLIKYALLLPIVFGMLIYTSVEVKAQEKQINNAQSTDSTENELVEKYYNEISVLKEKEKNLKIVTQYRAKKNKFKMSLDEFARDKAYFKTIFIDTYYEKKSKGKIKKKNKEAYDKLLEYYNRTYKEYLEEIKTDGYIKFWESKTGDGIQNLYVKDVLNITPKEQKKIDERIKVMLKDEYWHTLFITDGERSTTMNFRNANLEYEMQEIIDVPFAVVEVSPTLKNHSHVADNDERRRLISDFIGEFVNTNFDLDKANALGLPSGRKRIFSSFKIDKNGKVRDVNVRGPHPDLEAEVKRIIELLPQFAPGSHKGKPVVVPYSLPVVFEINEKQKE